MKQKIHIFNCWEVLSHFILFLSLTGGTFCRCNLYVIKPLESSSVEYGLHLKVTEWYKDSRTNAHQLYQSSFSTYFTLDASPASQKWTRLSAEKSPFIFFDMTHRFVFVTQEDNISCLVCVYVLMYCFISYHNPPWLSCPPLPDNSGVILFFLFSI